MGSDDATSPVILVLLVLLGVAVVGFLVIPQQGPYHHHSPGTAAIGFLKTIGSSQSLFREGDKDGDKTLDYGTLTELAEQSLIDEVLGSGTRQEYLFTAGPGTGAPEFVWWATAVPTAKLLKEVPDVRSFFTNHEGVIWYTTGGVVAPITSLAAPPPGWQVVGK